MRNTMRQMGTECMMCPTMSMCTMMMCSGMAVSDVRFSPDCFYPFEKTE